MRTFREEDGHEEAERDARHGERQQEEEEERAVRFLQNGQRSAAEPTSL